MRRALFAHTLCGFGGIGPASSTRGAFASCLLVGSDRAVVDRRALRRSPPPAGGRDGRGSPSAAATAPSPPRRGLVFDCRSDGGDMSEDRRTTLTERLAARLVAGGGDRARPMRACVAVAGGGSGAAAAIASVPGASSLLLESIVTYDRMSFAEFVSSNVALGGGGDDLSLLDDLEGSSGTPSSAGGAGSSSPSSSSEGGDRFKFSSAEAAALLSRSALGRSLSLTPSFRDRALHCVGVGCTSSLVGRLAPDGEAACGRKGRRSRAYVACTTLRGGTVVWEVLLDAVSPRRSRIQEESAVSSLVLLAMARLREGLLAPPGGTDDGEVLRRILDRDGDSLAEGHFGGEGASAAAAASRIVAGDADSAVVVPVAKGDEGVGMEALPFGAGAPLPLDILVVPGSFNPPHWGHVGLANAAVEALRRMRSVQAQEELRPDSHLSSFSSLSMSTPSSPLLRSMWSTVEKYAEDADPAVFFEMSVTNADKPPMDPSEAGRRVDLFATLPPEGMPRDWAVLLSNAPLFSKKAEVLCGLMPNDSSRDSSSFGSSEGDDVNADRGGARRRLTFVIGTDTLVRIIDPKYYGNDRAVMLSALGDMQDRGIHFIVGGRLEQGAGDGSRFVNGEEEVASLPKDVGQMFMLLSEEEFRLDISSTELRKRM